MFFAHPLFVFEGGDLVTPWTFWYREEGSQNDRKFADMIPEHSLTHESARILNAFCSDED